MDFSLAFNLTLNQFGISAKQLAQQSGVSEVVISRFRNGHEVRTVTLSRLLECLSVQQREHFFGLVASSENKPRINMESWVESATVEELHQMMLLISHKFVGQNSRNFETSHSAA